MTITHALERLGRIPPAPPIRHLMDALAHMLLKAVLYAGVMLGAVVLDMHYASVAPPAETTTQGQVGSGLW